ncbi:hypothetical protein X797_008019 [Metarhizium robertsii]|uniref:Uncharacterized protein n=1 Tax=Metarhizium robertsii TaxID=568076 RepID=A0A014PNI9_9HYPO|nr:hypothetical protein X797_008019 [Metarhizium robertsii]
MGALFVCPGCTEYYGPTPALTRSMDTRIEPDQTAQCLGDPGDWFNVLIVLPSAAMGRERGPQPSFIADLEQGGMGPNQGTGRGRDAGPKRISIIAPTSSRGKPRKWFIQLALKS